MGCPRAARTAAYPARVGATSPRQREAPRSTMPRPLKHGVGVVVPTCPAAGDRRPVVLAVCAITA